MTAARRNTQHGAPIAAPVDLAMVRHARARFMTTLAAELGQALALPRDHLPTREVLAAVAARHRRLTAEEIDALFRAVADRFPVLEDRADYGIATTIRFLTKLESEHAVRLLNAWRP